MTPRRQVDMIDLTADPEDIRRTIVESAHSRLPAHAGTPEEMLGVIQAKDLLDAYLRGERTDIRAQLRPAPNVPDTADALDVLGVIKRSPVHIALVHDEYGHFEGVVTNLPFLRWLVTHPNVRAGHTTTAFLVENPPLSEPPPRTADAAWRGPPGRRWRASTATSRRPCRSARVQR